MMMHYKFSYIITLFLPVFFLACSHEQKHEYLIAYNVLVDADDDNYDIFTMQMDGTNKRNITNNPDVAWTYLAFGQTIFFISDRDTLNRHLFLYEMNSAGDRIRQISHFRLQDSWMGCRYDGHELIVVPHRSIDSLLFIIDRNGSILKKIAGGTAYAGNPAFSPDGQKIAFVGSNRKSKREEGYHEEIYVANVDGSGLRQLTHYPENDSTAEWYAYKAGPPRWHPTENFISYQSKQQGKYSLFAVMTDGSKQWKLTNNPEQEGWHDWSPDGRWLAVELFDEQQSQFDIGLMDWQTKELKILTDRTYQYQQAPVFVERINP